MNYNFEIAENYFFLEVQLKEHLTAVLKDALLEEVFPKYKESFEGKMYTLYAIDDSYRGVLFFIDYGQGFPTNKDVEIGRYIADTLKNIVGEKTFEFFKKNYCSLHYRKKILSGTFPS